MADVQVKSDIDALRDLVTLYSRALDRRDYALMKTLFHPDAWLDFGPDYVAASVNDWLPSIPAALDKYGAMQHHITNSYFSVTGDSAEGETYLLTVHVIKETGVLYMAGARYLDSFERRDGRWAIIRRVAVQDWERPEGTVSGTHVGKLDHSDPSYTALELFRQMP